MPSRLFFSLPSSCARCGRSHSFGSSSSRFSASRRLSFASKSKIPPQLGGAGVQPGERGGDLVDAFGFHGFRKSANYTRLDEYSSAILSSKNVVGLGAFMKRR